MMNLKQINLFREMVRYFELATNNNIDFVLSKVRYAKETLDDLEDKIPTERQLELESNIIDFKYNIKKREHILKTLDFDEGNELNHFFGTIKAFNRNGLNIKSK